MNAESEKTELDDTEQCDLNERADQTAESESDPQPKPSESDTRYLFQIKALETKIAGYESKFADAREYVKKLESEVGAIRQRAERDQQKAINQKLSQFFLALLSIVDNLELSLKSAEKEKSPLAEGLRLIFPQFEKFLKAQGLERMTTVGEKFDPVLHEGITTQPVSDLKKVDTILHEVKAGYRFADQVIRPAQVVVGASAEA